MNEIVKEWLKDLYDGEIEETKANISNQHLWELGYDGEEPNPHTQNIEDLKEYLGILENLKNAL